MRTDRSLPTQYLHIPDSVNVTDHIVSRHACFGQAERVALRFDSERVTFGELDERTSELGAELMAQGVAADDRVVMTAASPLDQAVAFLAAMRVGAVPVSYAGPFHGHSVGDVVRASGARTVFAGECSRGRRRGGGASPAVDTSADTAAYAICRRQAGGPATMVVHAHRVVFAAGDPIRYGLPLSSGDRCLATGDLASTLGLDFGLLFPLAAGASSVVLSPQSDHDEVLAAAEREGATVLAADKDFFAGLTTRPELPERFALGSVRAMVCAGQPLDRPAVQRIEDLFGLPVHNVVGDDVAHFYLGQPGDQPAKRGALGLPLPGRPLTILRPDGTPADTEECGRLCLPADDPALAISVVGPDRTGTEPSVAGWYDTGYRVWRDGNGYVWPADPSDEE